jgi:hypothetical protein
MAGGAKAGERASAASATRANAGERSPTRAAATPGAPDLSSLQSLRQHDPDHNRLRGMRLPGKWLRAKPDEGMLL